MVLPHEEPQRGGTSGVGTGKDSGVIVTMFKNPVYMSFKSKEEGRDIYDEVDFISIKTAGQKRSTSVRKMTEADKERFPHIWEAYQNKESEVRTGTPIGELPCITRARSLELVGAGIRTIEALAALPDENLRSVGPGAINLKQKAKQFLEETDENSVKLDEANSRIAELEKKIESLMEINQAEKAEATANPAPKKKPGRPKKHVVADDSTECTE